MVERSYGWTAVLEGEAAAAALKVAGELGACVDEAMSRATDPATDDASLSRGLAGAAISFDHLARCLPGRGFDALAKTYLERAMDAVAAQPLSVSFMTGFPGISWAVQHLGEGDALDAIDAGIETALARRPWPGVYDLVSGLVGFGMYALERLPHPAAERQASAIVGHLDTLARRGEATVTWFTPPHHVPEDARDRVPNGYFNLGMAHGVPGVVAFLAQAIGAGLGGNVATELLDGAVAWVLQQRLPAGGRATWPYYVGPGLEPSPARLAWCYGDPGIILALFMAAEARGRDDWREAASGALERALRRAPEDSDVSGASLCHGASGLALLWARAAQRSNEDAARVAARHWASVTLDLRVSDDGIGGYSLWQPDTETGGDVQGPGLLAGIGGVAAVLAALATDVEPNWDRLMLASGKWA